jgi:hypothetical protein
MNKALLSIGILVLVVCIANTALLLQMGAKTKEAADKAASVAKELEKVAPIMKNLSEKMATLPPGKPPLGMDDGKVKLPGEASSAGLEPKLPPKSGLLPPPPLPSK